MSFLQLDFWMSFKDCETAVMQAREASGDDGLEVVPLSLPSVVEHLASIADGAEGTPFEFIAPSSSTEHISSYVGNGVYARLVDEEELAKEKAEKDKEDE